MKGNDMNRAAAIMLLSAAITLPSHAQVSPTTTPEGATLAVVQVPAGYGDGRVTERDAKALGEYCVWGFNRMIELEGVDFELGADAETRMLDFWFYVWEYVDEETQAIISVADVVWPAILSQYNSGDEAARQLLVDEFAAVSNDIWGGFIEQTVYYLAGELSAVEYTVLVDQAIAQSYQSTGGGGGGGGGGGVSSSSLDSWDSYVPDYSSDYQLNDGSGTIIYSSPY